MPFDNLCKYLSEKYPDRFVTWLLGETPAVVEILKTELGLEPIRADSITLLHCAPMTSSCMWNSKSKS